MNSTFRARWLASSEVISQVLFTSEQPKKNKIAFVGILSQVKLLLGPLVIQLVQEPITRSLQLPHIPVTAFPQTDPFLVWIYLEPQIPTGTLVTNCSHKHGLMSTCRNDVDMFTWGRIVLSSPKRAHVDWNWPISREKRLKIDWSVKMPLHWVIMGVAGS